MTTNPQGFVKKAGSFSFRVVFSTYKATINHERLSQTFTFTAAKSEDVFTGQEGYENLHHYKAGVDKQIKSYRVEKV